MAKYKIGQRVRFICDSSETTFLHITEITEVACSAGIQVFYAGRLWIPKQYSQPGQACHKDLWKANEIELVAIKKEKPKKKG